MAKNFERLRHWEEPHYTFSFLAFAYTIVFSKHANSLTLKGLKEQGRLGRSLRKVTIGDQPPSNTIQKIIALKKAMRDVETVLQNLNGTLLKIRTIVLSGQPQRMLLFQLDLDDAKGTITAMETCNNTSCNQIINWKACLKFPDEPKISYEAKDLICHLLCDVDTRLGTRGVEEIKAHPWFRPTQWDTLYEKEAAYKPTVTGELDTQNFENFPEVEGAPSTNPTVGPWRKVTLRKSDVLKSIESSGTYMGLNGSSKPPSLVSLLDQMDLKETVIPEGEQKQEMEMEMD